ncbi:MAG: hypothetical protein ACOX6T_09685 [Myxococcales bacterium]|jgi:hypothetical protein
MAEVKYTEFAQQAVSMADIFNGTFHKPLPGRPSDFRVELAVPDGPSTAGGRQGTQHIKLVPANGRGVTLVVGWANQAAGKAEIRGWEQVKAIAAGRRGSTGLPDEAAYRKLMLDMKRFFEREGLEVKVVATFRREDVDEGPEPSSGFPLAYLLVGLAVGLAIVLLFALFFPR